MCLCAGMSVRAQENKLPSDVIKVSGGLDFITSKMYLPEKMYQRSRMKYYSWQPGVSALVEYKHFWQSGFGFGLNFVYNDTRYYQEGHDNEQVSLALRSVYVGPCFAYSRCFKNRWRFDGSVGMGYGYLAGDLADDNGFGIMEKTGMEYMITRHLGVCVELYEMVFLLKDDMMDDFRKQYPSESNVINGVFHLGFTAGLSFYF